MRRHALPFLALPLVSSLGCGEAEWTPSPVGPPLESDLTLIEDLPVADRDPGEGAAAAMAAAAAEPSQIYLWYADGSPPPMAMPAPCKNTPPAYRCSFGTSMEDCRRQVQAVLDRWYADFNVVFTWSQPTSGITY